MGFYEKNSNRYNITAPNMHIEISFPRTYDKHWFRCSVLDNIVFCVDIDKTVGTPITCMGRYTRTARVCACVSVSNTQHEGTRFISRQSIDAWHT